MTGPRLIAVLCLAEIASMTGFGSFAALLPSFAESWQLSNTQAGWVNGIYFGAYMVAVPVLVSLTDRIDPRWVYIVSALATALASLGFALLAEGFWSALLLRAIAGAGLAGTYMPGLKALTDHLPEQLRARAVAFYTASFSIGSAASFYFTGELAAWLDWRWAIGLAAAGPVLALLAVLLLVPRATPHAEVRPWAALLDFRPVLRNRVALGYILAYWSHNWELFALRSWLVAFLVYAQDLQAEGALGLDWRPTSIATLVIMLGLPASVLGNEAAQRFGRRRVVTAVMAASAIIALGIGFSAPLPFVLIVAFFVLYGITVTGDSASITAGAVAAAQPELRGATMAAHSFIGFSGAFLGPLVFGVVLDLAGGASSGLAWGLAFASSGLAVALGPLALWFLASSRDDD